MRRAIAVAAPGAWRPEEQAGTITLAWADRHRRRIALEDDTGAAFLLDLARPTLLADGCGLRLEAGGVIAVRAALEPVIEARAADPAATARLAWHLGNRHTPVQITSDGGLRLLDDPVLAEMLQGLGAAVVRLMAPFSPEAGAYALGPARPRAHPHDHAD